MKVKTVKDTKGAKRPAAGGALPAATILHQEIDSRPGQWNKAVRALKIGDVYAEIHLRPENCSWKGQRPAALKVVHPRHGEIGLFCPAPKIEYPGTYSTNETAKTAALLRGLELLTNYLREWVRDFA